MTTFLQPLLPAEESEFIYNDGVTVENYSVAWLVLDPEVGSPSLQVLLIAKLDGKNLVAVPKSTWHRQVSRRIIPPPGLSKPNLVEVPVVKQEDMTEVTETYIKVWIGFLAETFMANLHTHLEEMECDYCFDEVEGSIVLPYAHSLVQVAQEHFAFFSAEEEAAGGDHPQDEPGEESGLAAGSAVRLEKLEGMMENLATAVSEIAKKIKTPLGASPKAQVQSNRPSTAAATTPRASALRRPGTMASASPRVSFPSLDQGVVQAAISAGVTHENLAQMERLISQNSRAKKIPDLTANKHALDPLSEEDEPGASAELVLEGDGLEEDGSPLEKTMKKLADIMEVLTEDKRRKTAKSKLDLALDSYAAGSSGDGSLSHGGQKAAAQRRALRSTFQEHPSEIFQTVERLLSEDLNSQTLAPGMPARTFNARAWVEHRSRIGNYKSSAFAAWGAAGILDALAEGDIHRARARAALLLLQFDQAAIDRGSWSLAGELSLEPLPPFGALSSHTAPNVADGEQPFSKLLDSRWAEVSLNHLKQQDDYLVRRGNVGKFVKKGGKEGEDSTDHEAAKRRAKAKPKAKTQGSPSSAES